jgi:geranylgeranyl reductase family protein
MSPPRTPPDVLIVGAGPAGSSLALFLARQGWHVLLVDRAEFPRDKTCGDGLTPRALSVLEHLGALEAVVAAGHRLNNIHLYAPDRSRVEAAIEPANGRPPYVAVLPRLALDDLLRQHAIRAGAEFRPQVNVTGVLRENGQVVGVTAEGPEGPVKVRARQTVLATGAAVGLLERAGLLERPALFGRAARAYYDGMAGIADAVEFHLESVPLPGYGWVFPTSATRANVGAGFFARWGRAWAPASPRQVYDTFIGNPLMAGRLAPAQIGGPVKSWPLRFDFPTARLAWPGLALVGEAAGLVNPLTGEGIDYALESAETAAEVLGPGLKQGQPAAALAQAYSRALRGRLLWPFRMICWLRDFYLHAPVLNRLARVARRDAEVRNTLMQVCLGNLDPGQGLALRVLAQLARG